MEQELNLREWRVSALDAIEHFDAAPACQLLRAMDQNITVFEAEYQRSPQFKGSIQDLVRKLKFVAFPDLPIEAAHGVLQKNILEFLTSDIDLADRLSARYAFVGYGLQEEDRKKLKEAILGNEERLGELAIGEWLKDFDSAFNPEKRDVEVISRYIAQNSRVGSLDKEQLTILKKLLKIYDQWLSTELLNIFDLAVLNSGAQYGKSRGMSGGVIAGSGKGSQSNMVNIPLLQALSKYENLGNQLITEERIKVKSQQEPVRPSLLYWIKYYRDELGVGHHDSVQRGQFLFRSENGKKLSAQERERVGLILKSVEENFPLSIDTEHQEIIFPAFNGVMIGDRKEPAAIPANARIIKGPEFFNAATEGQRAERAFVPARNDSQSDSGRPAAQSPYESGDLRVGRGTNFSNLKPAVSVEPGAVSFSTSHMFPAEKEAAENRAAVPKTEGAGTPAQVPRPVQPPAPRANPFRINPVSLGKKK